LAQIANESKQEEPMHSLFTPVDTLDTTTYLYSANHSNGSFDLKWLMPVTGLSDNGKSVMPQGFDSNYGLYLTITASGLNNPSPGVVETFNTMNVTLWADPKNDAGTPSSNLGGISFSGSTSNDIVLATGTLVSGELSVDSAGVRMATYVESLTPTLDGTQLLHGSIQQGDQLTEAFVTQPSEFQSTPQADGSSIVNVNGGAATVTLSTANGDPATIQIPNEALQPPHLSFLHHHARQPIDCR
jgi:hypothetical protein